MVSLWTVAHGLGQGTVAKQKKNTDDYPNAGVFCGFIAINLLNIWFDVSYENALRPVKILTPKNTSHLI